MMVSLRHLIVWLAVFVSFVQAQETGGLLHQQGYSLVLRGKIDTRFKTGEQPHLRLSLSVEKDARTYLTEVKQSQVQANLRTISNGTGADGDNVEALLKKSGSENVSVPVLFMLDVSGSMLNPEDKRDTTFNKMTVVRDAMAEFIKQEKGRAFEIATFFDVGMELLIVPKGASADDAVRKICGSTACDGSTSGDRLDASQENRPTALYESIQWAVGQAKTDGIRHIIFLTDGQDETFRGYQYFIRLKKRATPGQISDYEQWQSTQETDVIDRALGDGKVVVHTIGIGNPNAGLFKNAFTDCSTLRKVSDGTSGEHACIDTVSVRPKTDDPQSWEDYRHNIRQQLISVLNQLSETFRYDYDLDLSLDPNRLQRGKNTVRTTFHVEDHTLYVDTTFDWDGYLMASPKASFGEFFPHPNPDIDLSVIALPVGGVLGALALVPMLQGLLSSAMRTRQRRSAVTTLVKGSPFIGAECPEERQRLGPDYLLKAGDPVVVCPGCGTPHHLDCWIAGQNRCYLQHCRRPVDISTNDLDRLGFEVKSGQ